MDRSCQVAKSLSAQPGCPLPSCRVLRKIIRWRMFWNFPPIPYCYYIYSPNLALSEWKQWVKSLVYPPNLCPSGWKSRVHSMVVESQGIRQHSQIFPLFVFLSSPNKCKLPCLITLLTMQIVCLPSLVFSIVLTGGQWINILLVCTGVVDFNKSL